MKVGSGIAFHACQAASAATHMRLMMQLRVHKNALSVYADSGGADIACYIPPDLVGHVSMLGRRLHIPPDLQASNSCLLPAVSMQWPPFLIQLSRLPHTSYRPSPLPTHFSSPCKGCLYNPQRCLSKLGQHLYPSPGVQMSISACCVYCMTAFPANCLARPCSRPSPPPPPPLPSLTPS